MSQLSVARIRFGALVGQIDDVDALSGKPITELLVSLRVLDLIAQPLIPVAHAPRRRQRHKSRTR